MGFSLVLASGGHSSLRCAGPSLRRPLPLRSTGSRCVGFSSYGSRAPGHRLSSCGVRAQLLHGMWDPPGPGLEPVSPALAGGFLTTVPPGKPIIPSYVQKVLHFVSSQREGPLFSLGSPENLDLTTATSLRKKKGPQFPTLSPHACGKN